MAKKIAYLMSRFPHLPETFILREMNEIEHLGWNIALYPLIRQKQDVIHSEAKPWIDRARYSPYLSVKVIGANLRFLRRMPVKYLGLWASIFRENLSHLGFLIRSLILVPKACLLAEKMEREGIQHIHAHYATYPALVAWIVNRLTEIGYSVTVHAHDIFVRQEMLGMKLGGAKFIAAISDFNRRYLAEHVDPQLGGKTQVVHCGVDLSWYRPGQKTGQGGRYEIINIGSLQAYKGQIFLLQACRLLGDRGVDFRCRIIGEGQERRVLETFIDQNQLQNRVILLGAQSQDNVARLLPKAHCYVQPSVITLSGKMEGIPVALMEALASQLPVVATEISGIPELIRPGRTGYLVPPEDPVALADAIQHVLENKAQAVNFAQNGRKLVAEEFDLVRNSALLASLFDQHISDNQQEK